MENATWDKFVKKIFIKASINELYHLWASSGGIRSWFVKDAKLLSTEGVERPSNENCKAGDSYTWYWHNCDALEEGNVIKANGKDYLEISFASTKVSILLEETEYATLVTLTQFEIPEDDKSKYQLFYGCSNGWTFWLANLKAYCEHGILLHETELDKIANGYSGYEFVNM